MIKFILSTILTFSSICSLSAQNLQKSDLGQKQVGSFSVENSDLQTLEDLKTELRIFAADKHTFKECVQFNASFKAKVNSNDELIRDAGKQLKTAGQFMAWGAAATAVGSLLSAFGEPLTGSLIGLGGIVLTYSGYGRIEKAGRILNSAGK